eukprot:773103-Rhodomonas_salina.5
MEVGGQGKGRKEGRRVGREGEQSGGGSTSPPSSSSSWSWLKTSSPRTVLCFRLPSHHAAMHPFASSSALT